MIRDLARDNPGMKMVVNILRAGNIIDNEVSKVLKEFEITHVQFNILRVLEAASPEKLSVGEIKRGLFFPTSDVTRLLDRLEKRDLITRSLRPDNRRKMDITITDAGLQLIASSLPKIEEKLNGYYKHLVTTTERDQLIEILKRFRT